MTVATTMVSPITMVSPTTTVATTMVSTTTMVAATTLAATAVDNATTTAKMMEVAVCPTEAAGSTAPTHLEVVSRPNLAVHVSGFPPGASSAATSVVAGGAPNSRKMFNTTSPVTCSYSSVL